MGLVFLVMSVGSVLGPPLGGILHELGGWHLPFHVCGVAGATILVAATMCVTDPEDEADPASVATGAWKDPRVAALLGSVFVVGYCCSQMEPVLPLYLAQRWVGPGNLWRALCAPPLAPSSSSPYFL